MRLTMKPPLPLLPELPFETRSILGNRHYNAPNVQEIGDTAGRILVTTQYGSYPHTGDGVEVRRVLHKLRSVAIENFNEQFKGIFDGHRSGTNEGPAQHSPLCPDRHVALSVGAAVSFSTQPTFAGWSPQGVLEGGLMNYDRASHSCGMCSRDRVPDPHLHQERARSTPRLFIYARCRIRVSSLPIQVDSGCFALAQTAKFHPRQWAHEQDFSQGLIANIQSTRHFAKLSCFLDEAKESVSVDGTI